MTTNSTWCVKDKLKLIVFKKLLKELNGLYRIFFFAVVLRKTIVH